MTALARLKGYKAPPSIWDRLHFSRRAAVMAILYKNRYGNLSTILTVRPGHMSSFAGDAALPGGKADFQEESAVEVASRETHEEIGIPRDQSELAKIGYTLEHLTTLPAYLSRNLLAVRPSVAYLHPLDESRGTHHVTDLPSLLENVQLDPAEVHEVFSAQLERFLSSKPDGWYRDVPANWGGLKWNQHTFRLLRRTKKVGEQGWVNVWGLTANMLIDIARIAYSREPDMEHRKPGVYGDESILTGLYEHGVIDKPRERGENVDISFRKLFGRHSPLLDARKA